MDKYSVDVGRGLFETLNSERLLEYGATFSGEHVRGIIDVIYPETGTRAEFNAITLYELGSVDYVRNVLLGEGKYLACEKGDYRVLLPSENAKQCERYVNSAVKKLNRSLKLSRNTPQLKDVDMNKPTVRALLIKESLK